MKSIHAFALAWAMCTRVPLPSYCYPQQLNAQLQSLSVVFYPLVGLILGAALVLLAAIMPTDESALLPAVVVVTAWVLLTGAMHLDGLADSIDAYCASHKNNAVTLNVFKDPSCGPMAVVAIVLLLFIKIAALTVLLERQQTLPALLTALVVSRWVLFAFMAYTPYLREHGLATDMALKPYCQRWWIISAVVLLIVAFVAPLFLVLVFAAALLAWCWRKLWLKKIGGYVGDCLGALVEFTEALILLLAVLLC